LGSGFTLKTPNDLQKRLLEKLNSLFERRYDDSLDADDLCSEFAIKRQELELQIVPLLVGGWVEKDTISLSGYRLRLTLFGKQEYDRQTGNRENETIRESLLGLLAREYEKDVNRLTDSRGLEAQCNLDQNKVHFNLEIMESQGLVKTFGAGPSAHAKLTPTGKAAHDNPESRLVFLSHASTDKEIAGLLKNKIQQSWPNVKVFDATDPEELPPGSDWPRRILEALHASRIILVLATSRGLDRIWVWFEAGAAWHRFQQITSLCVGEVRKGRLPSPFSIYTALNIDEAEDFRSLFQILFREFGKPSQEPDYRATCKEIVRLEAIAASGSPKA
jgi:TIR domain